MEQEKLPYAMRRIPNTFVKALRRKGYSLRKKLTHSNITCL